MNLKQFLFKRGPYQYEVQFTSATSLAQARKWLDNQGIKDYEILLAHVNRQGIVKDYLFLNDRNHATYIRLHFG